MACIMFRPENEPRRVLWCVLSTLGLFHLNIHRGGGGGWNAHLLNNHGGGGQDEKIEGLHEKNHWGGGV